MRNIHNKILLSVVSSFLLSSNEVSALAFDFGSFFSKVKTGASQFIETNPYAQNIYNNAAQNFGQVLSNTKQQVALATQGVSGNLQQYAQQQGQQIGQQALQQRPQNFSQGVDYITKTAEDFGKGAWNNVQAVNQGIAANTPIAQQISLMTGSLNGALQLSGSTLQSITLPVGENGALIPLWLSEAQNTLSLLGQTNPQAMGVVELINMTQNQVKGIPTLAYKQQSGGMLMPGNVNWDYLVDSKGIRYSPEGVPLGGASPSYSDDQDMLVKIEKKRYVMGNLCIKIYNILISSAAQLSAIDQKLPQVILSTLQNLSKVGPTEQNADYYIKLATDQITATATMLKYSGQVKPVDNSWSVLVDSNGNQYSANGLVFNNVPATNQFNNTPALPGYNAAPALAGYNGGSATNQFNNAPALPGYNAAPAPAGYNSAPAPAQKMEWEQSSTPGLIPSSSSIQLGAFDAAPAGYTIPD